ncbi:hypothetical protein [Streptomyces sp. NPDC002790]|uniref:hypothetical protein n=1 Tax=Streptomyces sp. NPDC002790 TaxID=3154431 RepID=UPI0033234623
MVVRAALVAVFLTGLAASFVKPFADFLEGRALLGGSLLSVVALLLYEAIVDLREAVDRRPVPRITVSSDELKVRVDAAFSAREVEIRFLGYTGETLVRGIDQGLRRLLDGGHAVESISIRLLIPDFSRPMVVPSLVGEARRPVDDERYRRRLVDKASDFEAMLNCAVDSLRLRGRLPESALSCEYRVFQGFPRDKLVILNGETVLHGLCDVRTTRPMGGKDYYDPEGANTSLVEVARRRDGSAAGHGVDTWAAHFDGLWELAAPPPWSEANRS